MDVDASKIRGEMLDLQLACIALGRNVRASFVAAGGDHITCTARPGASPVGRQLTCIPHGWSRPCPRDLAS